MPFVNLLYVYVICISLLVEPNKVHNGTSLLSRGSVSAQRPVDFSFQS